MARRSRSMAGRAYQFKYDMALRDYNKAIESGVDQRAALKTFAASVDAARREYQGAAAKVFSRDTGESTFYGAAGAAGVGGASTLAGTAGNTAASSNTSKVNYQMAGTPTGGGADVSLISLREEYVAPKITKQQEAPAEKIKAAAVEKQKEIRDFARSEIELQKTLEPIRQRRRRAAEQQASLLRRTTGRRALLASPAGGAGFFGGYFKG